METKKTNHYDVVASDARIKEILDSVESFEDVDSIPNRQNLTYNNGYYVNCTSVFIDIRGSSKFSETHTRPVIGKIYRAYISECVAIMNNDPNCREVVITGDCVHGIMNTPFKSDVDRAMQTTYSLNALINVLNWRLKQKGYKQISCGIGIAYGRALMIQAGFKGSKLNEVIWMGDVVNEASNLCHQGNKNYRKPIQVSSSVYNNLNAVNKNLLSPVNSGILGSVHYECDIVNSEMYEWLEKKKKSASNYQGGIANLLYGSN